MELQNYGPIAQAGNNLQPVNNSGNLIILLAISIGVGLIAGYMIYSLQFKQPDAYNKNQQ